ncbi:GNAT family N-acetyltransferase [Paenibacillus sp. OV219]|uniref:GNAT family N-acetyltransferase n=1 Tax=Paenibacillus sp. OV219 TaxID=1884377 RepID=UPI0008C6856A|nr:GNAT family N-acetyltransferase [Paenibacillus sp. OV219]SEN50555.1 ribosomal-protein-alanine N-acetyltransferase [Paenibacillus sp. OV219]
MQLITERLLITVFDHDNGEQVAQSYRIGKHIAGYLGKLKEDAELLGWGVWFVTLQGSGQVIGDIGFKGKPDPRGKVEVGYGIIPDMHNKGIATEAVGAIMKWAFSTDKVNRIVAECLVDNGPSIRVLEKLGMTRTGTENGMIYWEIVKKTGHSS